MPATLISTCPLCGLRFSNRPLLELHIREDHRPRGQRAAHDDRDADDAREPAEGTGSAVNRHD